MSVFQLCKLHSTCVMKCYKILSTLKAQISVTLWRFSVRALSTSLTEKKNTILTQNWCWCRIGLQHFCLDQHEGIWRLRHASPCQLSPFPQDKELSESSWYQHVLWNIFLSLLYSILMTPWTLNIQHVALLSDFDSKWCKLFPFPAHPISPLTNFDILYLLHVSMCFYLKLHARFHSWLYSCVEHFRTK